MKTFAEGELLTAQDVNNELNPNTAPNVPYAAAAGNATITIANSVAGDATVTFPTGRFNRAPILIAVILDSWKRYWIRAAASSATVGTISLYAPVGTNVTDTVQIRWFAVQMQAGSAGG